MAWQCSGKSNLELISNLVSSKLLSTPRLIEAFKSVDRAHFVRSPGDAYMDSPSSIGFGATISAPHMHVAALESLLPYLTINASVLDVGCGSGFLLPIFHHLVSPGGLVLGVDHLQSLVDLSYSNLSKSQLSKEALDSGAIKLLCADGRSALPTESLPEGGFDAIHVGAAASSLPTSLLNQLKSPGRMFVPIGDDDQAVFQIDKDENGLVTKTRLFGVRYIPLTDANIQDPRAAS